MALSIPSPFSLGLLYPPMLPSFVYSKSQRNLPTGYVQAHAFFSSGTRKWPRKEEQHSLRSKASMENSAKGLKEANEISRAILIWRAVKLPIYSVALVPLTVGSAAAYLQSGGFLFGRYLLLLSSSILIILWLNLSNDVYDFDTGADQNKKESVVNLVGRFLVHLESRAVTHYAANLSLALGFMGLVWASAAAGDIQPFLLLISAVLCGYVYQCPPFRLSYKGLGEPLCFAAFGPFATTAFYMSQRTKSKLVHLPLNATVLSASLLVGLTTSLILFCSHFHQVDEDRAVGKMSPLVRLGTETASKVVKVAVVILYSLLVVLGLCRALPWTCIVLCALTFPIGKLVVDFVKEHYKDKGKIFMAKYYCVRLHTSFGAALAAGLAAARIVVKTKTVWGT